MMPFITLLHILILQLRPFSALPEFYVFPYLASHAQTVYSHIIDQHFPGLLLLPINLYTLGFKGFSDLKQFWILTVLVQSIFVSIIAKKLWNSRSIQLCVTSVFTILQPLMGGNVLWLDTLIPLATLPGLLLLLHQRFFFAGLLLGVGIILKQTMVLLVIAVCILVFYKYNAKRSLLFLGGAILAPLSLFVYVLFEGSIRDFIYWTFIFNITTYPKLASISPNADVVKTIGIVLVVVLLFLRSGAHKYQKILLVMMLILSSIGGFARLDMYHLHAAVPYSGLIIGYLLSTRTKLAMLTIGIFAIFLIRVDKRQKPYNYLDASTLQLIDVVKNQTSPSQQIFLLGVQPHVYSLTKTLPPENFFFFNLPWYFEVLQDRQLEILNRTKPELIIIDSGSNIDGVSIQSSASKLVEFTNTEYNEYDRMDNFIFYRRK